MTGKAYIIIRVEVNPRLSGDSVLQMAEEIRSTVEGTFFDQVYAVTSETERRDGRTTDERPMSQDRENCPHQYWDLGWCIDCGIHSNDPEYARHLRERATGEQRVTVRGTNT